MSHACKPIAAHATKPKIELPQDATLVYRNKSIWQEKMLKYLSANSLLQV